MIGSQPLRNGSSPKPKTYRAIALVAAWSTAAGVAFGTPVNSQITNDFGMALALTPA